MLEERGHFLMAGYRRAAGGPRFADSPYQSRMLMALWPWCRVLGWIGSRVWLGLDLVGRAREFRVLEGAGLCQRGEWALNHSIAH